MGPRVKISDWGIADVRCEMWDVSFALRLVCC
jgi:hypothetical protein